MARGFLLKIAVLFLIQASCSNSVDLTKIEVPQPKHPIIGKWKSSKNGSGTTFILDFQDNNLLKVRGIATDGEVFEDNYNFEILKDNDVEFDYETNLAGEMMVITARVIQPNELKLRCRIKNEPKVNGLLDPPILCFDFGFIKVE